MSKRAAALQALDQLGIAYQLTEHAAVFTIEEMDKLGITDRGAVCKNLFLRDAKGKNHYLVLMPANKQADLKSLAALLDSTKLSFASEDRLQKHLGLEKGAVTPLGLINNHDHAVTVALDRDLQQCQLLGVHPNENTATLWLRFEDLLRFVESRGNPLRLITL